VAVQLYSSWCGLLLSSDSYNYLSAAKSFHDSGEFRSPDGTYFVAWPPLFPVLLSLVNDPLQALMILHVALKIGVGILLFYLARTFIQSTILLLAFLMVSLCGVHLTMISVFAWSELLFLFLMLLNMALAKVWRKKKSYLSLFFLTGFLVCLQRNAGFFYIAAVSVGLFLDEEETFIRRLTNAIAFFVVCISGLVLWIIRAHIVSEEFQFSAFRFFEDPMFNAYHILSRVGELVVPDRSVFTPFVGLIVLVVPLLLFRSKPEGNRSRTARLPMLVCVIYLVGLTLLGKLDLHELDRLLAIVVPLIYLLAIAGIDKLARNRARITIAISLFILVIWTFYPLLRTAKNARLWHNGSCFSVLNK
jgi:hypothetical protein